MADTFQFKLVTPTGVLFDGAVEQVTAVGALGEFGVLPLHINFITSLVPPNSTATFTNVFQPEVPSCWDK